MARKKTKSKFGKKTGAYRLSAKKLSAAAILARRIGLRVGIVTLALWVGSWIWLSGSIGKAHEWSSQKIISASADMGFTVQNIMVEGRINSDSDILLGVINAQKGDALFSFNLEQMSARLEEITWVKSARVERRLPDTLYIGLQERRPMALLQKNKKLSLIDEDGAFLSDRNLKKFNDLVIIAGKDAPARAPELLEVLAAEPVLQKRVESASRIGARRWDLKMNNGVAVRLPENDMGLAIRRLALAQEKDGLLDKDILGLDLRKNDRIIIRTRPGKVQEYKASYKPGNDI